VKTLMEGINKRAAATAQRLIRDALLFQPLFDEE
jgi:hypothetical protein